MVMKLNRRTLIIALCFAASLFILPYFSLSENATEAGNLGEANWGLSFREPGKTPVANASREYLQNFDAYFVGPEEEKVIYLTFDAGYENGNMPKILDALKKHNAPAAFFLVGNFFDREPDLVRKMVADGHTIGNHTLSHPDMSKLRDMEKFSGELSALAEKYKSVTGEEMKKFYRPPQGKFSESNLKMAQELGYKTVFWSLAYVDWYDDKQPTHEEALKTLTERIHPGAVVLLHSTSRTNGEILDELLTKWETMGYTFKSIDELK